MATSGKQQPLLVGAPATSRPSGPKQSGRSTCPEAQGEREPQLVVLEIEAETEAESLGGYRLLASVWRGRRSSLAKALQRLGTSWALRQRRCRRFPGQFFVKLIMVLAYSVLSG